MAVNNMTTVRNKIPITPLGSVFSVVGVLSANIRQSKKNTITHKFKRNL